MQEERDLKEEFGQEEYTGQTNEAGQRHGKGRLMTPLYVYEGDWVNGLKHGKGVARYKDGTEYNGEWQNDVKHGAGEIIERVLYGIFLERYKGSFADDMKDGSGRQELKSGKVYYGEFRRGLFQGEGQLKDEVTGYSYKGMF